ncbi:MAG TPA: RluA family pseudouridine synthase [Saprospiraceae bacterium]|nr:RluA family pseudouridine synthase [Saprospiraceae bacterium]HNT19310.1 RluA family pseudouridine synthase [Saprospiraceae bacterium]
MQDQGDEPMMLTDSDDLQDQLIIEVDKNQSPLRIDSFLNNRIKNVSRTRIQQGIRAGAITVDGKNIKPNFKIAPLQTIRVIVPRHEAIDILPEDLDLDVVYEDDFLLVVNKPAGMVVHPGLGNPRHTLLNAVAFHLNIDPRDPPEASQDLERMGLVHRIDKETSGLLVIAKTEYALSHLAKQFYDHTSSREYLALVWGEPVPDKGTVDLPIGRHPRFRQLFSAFPERDQGKHAVTHYEVVEKLYYVSLIRCRLETGRTHQIRVHMQYLGHPVFHDERYGGDRIVKGTVHTKYKQFVDNLFKDFPQHALHAKSLGFVHPESGKWMQFDSELPVEFEVILNKWRKYTSQKKLTGHGPE